MPIARRQILDPKRPGWVHAIQRCARQAFLAGDRSSHRKQWVEDRLRQLAGIFACDVAAYAVMSNHLHIVLRMDPAAAEAWSERDAVERWLAVFGKRVRRSRDGAVDTKALQGFAGNAGWVTERRERLSDLSWFMRALCEDIAVRANREDQTQGRFWNGRYTSVPLLDQAALIACMAYVDLNPIRAKAADRPERSPHTGVFQRIRARQHGAAKSGDDALWLCPLERCLAGEPLAQQRFHTDDYLQLVDLTGRALRPGKRGAIPAELAPLLARLDLDAEGWINTVQRRRSMSGSAVGSSEHRAREAERRGRAWLRNFCDVFSTQRTRKAPEPDPS